MSYRDGIGVREHLFCSGVVNGLEAGSLTGSVNHWPMRLLCVRHCGGPKDLAGNRHTQIAALATEVDK